MGTLVDQALGVVDVAVIPGASRVLGVGRVGKIEEDETRETAAVTRLSAVQVEHVGLLGTLDDVVHTSQG